jgi:hypothetical protein
MPAIKKLHHSAMHLFFLGIHCIARSIVMLQHHKYIPGEMLKILRSLTRLYVSDKTNFKSNFVISKSSEKFGLVNNSCRLLSAKSLYSRLFDYIVMRINQSIPFQSSNYYIGIFSVHFNLT